MLLKTLEKIKIQDLFMWLKYWFQTQEILRSVPNDNFGLQKYGYIYKKTLNSLPTDKFLDWSKFKAFADNKMKMTVS